MDLEVEVSITIGSIPLRSEWEQISPPILPPGSMMPTLVLPPGVDTMQPPMAPPPMPSQMPGQMPPYPLPTGAAALPPSYGSLDPSQYGANFNTNYGPPAATAPPAPGVPSAPVIFAPYPDMPPPTYSEAFGMGASLKDDDDNDHIRSDEYKPLYPTYKWN